MTTPEGKIKAQVKRVLNELGAYSFMPVQNGMGAPALDFYCCINSRFVAIETKVPGKKLTPRQKQTAENINGAGGTVYVIRDKDDIKFMIHDLSLSRYTPPWIYDKCP